MLETLNRDYLDRKSNYMKNVFSLKIMSVESHYESS